MKSKSSRRPLLQTVPQNSPLPQQIINDRKSQQFDEYVPLWKSNFNKFLRWEFKKDRLQDKALIVKMGKVLEEQKKLALDIVQSDNN